MIESGLSYKLSKSNDIYYSYDRIWMETCQGVLSVETPKTDPKIHILLLTKRFSFVFWYYHLPGL